jgi:serine/threonine-protein phosphatase 5
MEDVALKDAMEAVRIDPTFVKAYYRQASAHMSLGRLKDAIKDFKEVLRLAPGDSQARQKLLSCQKELKQQEFEKAIFYGGAADQLVDPESIVIEESYDGPHLPAEGVTLDFVTHLLDHMKKQKKLHLKYTLKILLAVLKYFESRPTIEDVVIPEGSKLTVCGDIHGQYYDLLNIFSFNGMPSPQNMY